MDTLGLCLAKGAIAFEDTEHVWKDSSSKIERQASGGIHHRTYPPTFRNTRRLHCLKELGLRKLDSINR